MNAELMQTLSEFARRLENLIRHGTIEQADYQTCRVRVRSGDMLTDWIPWLTMRAGNDRDWWPPEQGEQVLLLCPSGDASQGYALPAAYQQAHQAPANSADIHRREYADGSFIEYNRADHRLSVTVNGGNVDLNVTGNVDAAIGGDANVTADGNINMNSTKIQLNNGVGVVTGECICAFTGNPHSDKSSTVTAGK